MIENTIANSIWLRDMEGFDVKQSFLDVCADYYKAQVYKAAFDQSTVNDINKWVSDNTGGKIEKIIDDLDPMSKMHLINTVYFEAKWVDQYRQNQIQDGVFNAVGGEKREVKMLKSVEHTYLSGDNCTGFVKDYEGGYSFIALLPDEDTGLDEFIESLSAEKLAAMLKNREDAIVHSTLPKFTYKCRYSLKDALQAMGIKDAFNSFNADFTGMTDSIPLYIGEVTHSTYIDLDENGTTAAAVTDIDMRNGSAFVERKEYTVTLDRPFVYMIMDNTHQLPIFIGTVTDLK